jgi:thioesterase III
MTAKKPHEYNFQVLEMHLDTFGHMNHATYLTIFEQARWEWITGRGYGLKEIHESQIGPTILELQIQYKRELRLREAVRIESVCTEWKGKVGKLTQKMFNKAGEECAVIHLTFGVFDMQKRRLVQAPQAWLYALDWNEG